MTVVNPIPGGGTSNALTFTINASNPKPTITELRPNSTAFGNVSGPWLVIGSNFAAGARVRWNGSNRDSYAGSSDGTVLGYYPSASDIASAGTASVSVFNPAPGGGESNSMQFTITASNPNPVLLPAYHQTQSRLHKLSVVAIMGSQFQAGARVSIGGVSVPVSSVSSNQITVTTIADSIPGTYDVMVLNPDGDGCIFKWFCLYCCNTYHSAIGSGSKIGGGNPFQLDVHGEDFTQGTVVYWGNSVSRDSYYRQLAPKGFDFDLRRDECQDGPGKGIAQRVNIFQFVALCNRDEQQPTICSGQSPACGWFNSREYPDSDHRTKLQSVSGGAVPGSDREQAGDQCDLCQPDRNRRDHASSHSWQSGCGCRCE